MNLTDPIYDVAIIGGGFSGTMVAVQLLRNSPTISVALIDRTGGFGRGVAYAKSPVPHLLNVPVAKMSAFPDEPSHFLNWLDDHPESWARAGLTRVCGADFVPRSLFGEYLVAILARTTDGRACERIADTAVDLRPFVKGAMRVVLASGRHIRARKVVLAVGNFPPGDPKLRDVRFHRSERYLHDPWSSDALDRLAAPGDILVLGSGLTGLDLLQRLQRRKTEGVIHVLSRRGLFPQTHRSAASWPSFIEPDSLPQSARVLLRLILRQVYLARREGVDWRAVIDSLRPHNAEIWGALPQREKRRFLRHLRPYWESHRHRAAPSVLSVKDDLERAGRLRCHRGRLKELVEVGDFLQATFTTAGSREVHLRLAYAVNCTGPECNFQQLDDPLIVQLFARGLIRPDRLYLGLDVTDEGALIDTRGHVSADLFTLGSPQKGRLMETTAVPEIRLQARDLAHRLLEDLARHSADSLAGVRFDPDYEYHI